MCKTSMGKSQSSRKKTLINQVFISNVEKCLSWKIPISNNIVLNSTLVDSDSFYAVTTYDETKDIYTISISELIWKEYPRRTKFALTQILFHELIHTCPDCFNHGTLWKYWAKWLNAEHRFKINPFPYSAKETELY